MASSAWLSLSFGQNFQKQMLNGSVFSFISEIECPEIISPKNGRLECDKSNLYGSECRVVCDSGYRNRNDINSVRCMANRRWNPVGSPECGKLFSLNKIDQWESN